MSTNELAKSTGDLEPNTTAAKDDEPLDNVQEEAPEITPEENTTEGTTPTDVEKKEAVEDEKDGEEGDLEALDDLNDNFRSYFEETALFRNCKQPNQYYMASTAPLLTR